MFLIVLDVSFEAAHEFFADGRNISCAALHTCAIVGLMKGAALSILTAVLLMPNSSEATTPTQDKRIAQLNALLNKYRMGPKASNPKKKGDPPRIKIDGGNMISIDATEYGTLVNAFGKQTEARFRHVIYISLRLPVKVSSQGRSLKFTSTDDAIHEQIIKDGRHVRKENLKELVYSFPLPATSNTKKREEVRQLIHKYMMAIIANK